MFWNHKSIPALHRLPPYTHFLACTRGQSVREAGNGVWLGPALTPWLVSSELVTSGPTYRLQSVLRLSCCALCWWAQGSLSGFLGLFLLFLFGPRQHWVPTDAARLLYLLQA